DLPFSDAGRAADGRDTARPAASQPYVPASDKWIELGVPLLPATAPGGGSEGQQTDLGQKSPAIDPGARPGRNPERRQTRRERRGAGSGAERPPLGLRTHGGRPRPGPPPPDDGAWCPSPPLGLMADIKPL